MRENTVVEVINDVIIDHHCKHNHNPIMNRSYTSTTNSIKLSKNRKPRRYSRKTVENNTRDWTLLCGRPITNKLSAILVISISTYKKNNSLILSLSHAVNVTFYLCPFPLFYSVIIRSKRINKDSCSFTTLFVTESRLHYKITYTEVECIELHE